MSAHQAMQAAIFLPILAGVVVWLLPRGAGALIKAVALAALVVAAWAALWLHAGGPARWAPLWAGGLTFGVDGLSGLMLVVCALTAVALAVFSIGFVRDGEVSPRTYYACLLWVAGSAAGVLLARDLWGLVGWWALAGVPLYLLVNLGPGEEAAQAAKKSLIVLGGSDALMILGVGIVYALRGTGRLEGPPLALEGMAVVACLSLAAAAFAKAGVVPLHSWVPAAAAAAPAPVAALLPASLDKVLGVYLFARVCLDMFQVEGLMQVFFLLVGAATVVAGVMAALVQGQLRRLLGYDTVSQAGYMVIGVASGTAAGLVGGLFHMLNVAVCKACLFLTAGQAERQAGTGELDRIGGLVRAMPLGFAASLATALAVAGVPPLSGFTSKWLVFRGIVDSAPRVGPVWVVVLAAAMVGSALTLAVLMGALHAAFLGSAKGEGSPARAGISPLEAFPVALLAVVSVAFGVWALRGPVGGLIVPALGSRAAGAVAGTWQPALATVLLCAALVVGLLVYLASARVRLRVDEPYVGGESGRRLEEFDFGASNFYRPVGRLAGLSALYRHAAGGWYDLYELGRRLAGWVELPLRRFHSGYLLTYVAWFVVGLVALLWLVLS